MADIVETHNGLAAKVEEILIQNDNLESKMVDMEDRVRRNKLQLRGIPETVGPADIYAYILSLFKTLIPEISQDMLLLDRHHRVPKPQFISADISRDVLVHIHYYHIKEAVLKASRSKKNMPSPHQGVMLFTDISAFTLKKAQDLFSSHQILAQEQDALPMGILRQAPDSIRGEDGSLLDTRSWYSSPPKLGLGTTKRPHR
ncbi:Hypothetical predicted protein [Pelobates cultripes]|uniref:Uncharacterized protein n=1 Tax=Pelobates cultripes TaxID=61616 RepID=A0AAD1VTX5_PELCU|nr:Hypothetical predicted protein [Pelobates cultripes]